MSTPRFEVASADDLDLDNGPDERWYVVCRHGSLIGHRTKADATNHRAALWAARRASDAGVLDELCGTGECSAEAMA